MNRPHDFDGFERLGLIVIALGAAGLIALVLFAWWLL